MEQLTFFLSLALLLLLQREVVVAQPAAAPAPPGPTNITAILEKAGQFGTLIRLLQSTGVGDQINTELNNSNQGMSLLAPTDSAFSVLKPGTLNGLSDQEKVSLIQFHILPNYVTISQFQTVSNPVRTQAGNTANGQYPLNVTTTGNQVNISTGINNASIANTIYTDNQLAVYEVDKVLLPLDIFGPHPPAPAPAPSKPKKPSRSKTSAAPSSDGTADSSGAVSLKLLSLGMNLVVFSAVIWGFWL